VTRHEEGSECFCVVGDWRGDDTAILVKGSGEFVFVAEIFKDSENAALVVKGYEARYREVEEKEEGEEGLAVECGFFSLS